MANTIFKGFKMVTSAVTTFDADYLYFVRTNNDKADGYLYFNGKKYGTAIDAANDIKALIGNLPDGFSTVVAYIENVYDELSNAISAETANREAQINAESIARESGDASNAQALADEVAAREAAISAEAAARESAITAEAAAREAADNALLGNINKEMNDRQIADENLASAITAEVAAREAAISAETAAREAAISAEAAAREAAITAETAAREAAISAEAAAREAADSAEAAAREAADSALTNELHELEQTVEEDELVTASALTNLDERVKSIEDLTGQTHTHANKGVLDGITAEKVAAWDSAEQNANDYTDTAIEALDATVTGASSGVTVTVAEENGVLTAATAELHISTATDNAVQMKDDGIFAAIYFEDLDV